jgi:hypothetical protein
LDLRQRRSLRNLGFNILTIILSVANGGAGLILIGQDGSADAEISVVCHFLFVRSKEAALEQAADRLDKAAAPNHH